MSQEKNKSKRSTEIDDEKKVNVHVTNEPDEIIDLRWRGRADFDTSRWLNLQHYHQPKKGKDITDVSEDDVEKSPYHQEQFGFVSKGNLEYQALGVLSLDCFGKEAADKLRKGENRIGGTVSSLVSLINAILTCTSSQYQEEVDEVKRFTLCSQFYNKALKDLYTETKYPSNDAKILNIQVRGWLPITVMEKLIMYKLVNQGKLQADDLFFIDKKIQQKQANKIPSLKTFLESYISTEGNYFISEIIYSGDDFKTLPPLLSRPYSFIYETRKVIKIGKIKKDDEIRMKSFFRDDIKEVSADIIKIERNYKWIGEDTNITDYIQFLDSITNEEYHKLLLEEDSIDVNSIFYNCRGGYLFRYYHSRGKSLPEIYRELTPYGIRDGDNEEEYYTQCFQFAFLADVYDINIKAYSMPDTCPLYIKDPSIIMEYPDTIGKIILNPKVGVVNNKDIKRLNEASFIENRMYCVVDSKFSFYPTALNSGLASTIYFNDIWSKATIGYYDSYLSEIENVDLLEYWKIIGDPLCGNIINRDTFTIKTYYHHYEVSKLGQVVVSGQTYNTWSSKDLHNGEDPSKPTPIKGVYVPLGLALSNLGLIKTVFF